jgi:integrase
MFISDAYADIDRFIDTNPYSPSTIENYRRVLRLIFAELGNIEDLTASGLKHWLESHTWGNATQWTALCAVRAFIRYKFGENHPALMLHIKRLPYVPQRTLKLYQVEDLISSFDQKKIKGRRDIAICCLALDSGLRCAELCRLEVGHVDLLERSLKVRIKGGSIGDGVFSQDTSEMLSRWIIDRRTIARPGVRTIFVSISGNTKGDPLTTAGLRHEMSRWARCAGLSALSPHDLRRTFATISTKNKAPARVLQVAGRWKDMQMIQRYTQAIQAHDFDPYFPVAAAMRDL